MRDVAGRCVHPDKAKHVWVVKLRHDLGFSDQLVILLPDLVRADVGL